MRDFRNQNQWALVNSNGYIIGVRSTRTECVGLAENLWSMMNWRQIKKRWHWRVVKVSVIPGWDE